MATARDRKEAEHQDITSGEGLELVPLMKSQATGDRGQTAGREELFFHQLGPPGRVGLVVAMSVCCCLSPSHVIFLRGRTGAVRASFVDWCDLDLK